MRDLKEHGGKIRAVDINHSDWDCTLERTPHSKTAHALRLGFREIKGFSDAHAENITTARTNPFTTIQDFAQRTGLSVPALRSLAEADALRSIGLDRRQALWEVTRFAETGTPAALLADLPLFATSQAEPLPEENEEVALPDMSVGEHVLQDYATIRMSLKAHPVGLLRERFASLGYVTAEQLATLTSGRRVEASGIVLVRQRPGSASGVVFATLEDETGVSTSSSGRRSSTSSGARSWARACSVLKASCRSKAASSMSLPTHSLP